jgi:uncharacterized protein YkwD
MKSFRLAPLEVRNGRSKVTNRLAKLALLIGLLAICQVVLGQSLQTRPVARLISEPTVDTRYSRPRRVKSDENSHEATGIVEVASSASPGIEGVTAIERRAFEQTNSVRIKNGLAPLVWDATLCRMARVHSEQMAHAGFFSHETPGGLHLKDRAHASGILHFRVIAENIAYNKGYDDPGGFAVERWMISSGHRANILYRGFQASAIGSYVSVDGSTYLTQVFITR